MRARSVMMWSSPIEACATLFSPSLSPMYSPAFTPFSEGMLAHSSAMRRAWSVASAFIG